MTIKLGSKVKDLVTGFEGIVTGRCEYINGCIQFCVRPKSKGGSMPDGQWIDWQQLKVLGEGISVSAKAATGGPQSSPPKSQYRG